MIEHALLDKFKVIYELILSSPLFLILILGILLMFIDINYISGPDKRTKKLYGAISFVVIGLFLYSYKTPFLNILDAVAKNVVAIVYFPSVLEYIVVLLISILVLAYSVFSSEINSIVKKANIIVFIINIILFLLVLNEISISEIDLSNKISIYTNTNMMVLLELSLLLFMIWLVGLFLYKFIMLLLPKESLKEEVAGAEVYDMPKLKEPAPAPFTLDEYREMRTILEELSKN